MLLVGEGRVFTRDPQNPMVEKGGVLIDDGKILKIGEFEELKKEFPHAEIVDAHGKDIMPSMINCHHHIYSAFARGLTLNGYNPTNFLEILEGQWWRMDRTLDVEDSRFSAAAVYLSCIENGVTAIFDHHASYGGIEGSLFAIADEAKKFGVRSCLCYEISDRDGKAKMEQSVKENIEFAKYAKNDPAHLAGLIGLHASFTLSDQTLDYVKAQNVDNVGYHVHVAEGILDQERCLAEHNMRVVHRLNQFGILGPKSIAGHCVHITDDEREVIKATNTMVVHNPESNMGNAIGAPDILKLMKSGILLGLGTDGYTSDMLESLKFANLLVKHAQADATVGFNEVTQMLFENNPAMVEKTFGIQMGVLKEGAVADLIVVDYDEIAPMNAGNLNGHMLFGMNGRNVITTISDGVVRMKDRELVGLDREKIVANIRERAASFGVRVNS